MRILLIADVHANWPALAAIQEPFDVALFLGDLVEYGVEPAPCIDWVRTHCRYRVRGNHDHGAAQNVAPPLAHALGFKFLTGATRLLGRERLTEKNRRFLAELPLNCHATIDARRFLLVHATPRDPLDEYAPPDEGFWAKRLEYVEADVICVGHTHQPYVLQIGSKLVINPGSVGLQRHGDPRVSYAILENGQVTLRRVEYDIEQSVRAVDESPLPDQVKQLLTRVYREGRLQIGANGNGVPRIQITSRADIEQPLPN